MSDMDRLTCLEQAPGSWLAQFPPRRWHLWLAGAALVAVYLLGVSAKWWPTPDSALYLGLGRSLARGRYEFNGRSNNLVPPGLPLILAALRILFGEGIWAPNLFMALCGLGALAMIYLTVARISDRRMALAVTLAAGLSYAFYNNAHRILTDMPFVALFWTFFYALLRYLRGRRWWLVLGVLTALAAVTIRLPGLLVMGLLLLAMVADGASGASWPRRLAGPLVALAIVLAAAGAFFLLSYYYTNSLPRYAKGLIGSFKHTPPEQLGKLARGLADLLPVIARGLTDQNGLAATLLACIPAVPLMLVGLAGMWRSGQRPAVILVVISPVVLSLLMGGGFVDDRYLLPVWPLFLLALFNGLCMASRAVAARLHRPVQSSLYLTVVTVAVTVIVACNLARVLRDSLYYSAYLSRTDRYYSEVRNGWFEELPAVAEVIKEHGGNQGRRAAIGQNKLSILHYLSDRPCAGLPMTRCETRADAEHIRRAFMDRRRLHLIVLDIESGQSEYLAHLKAIFEDLEREGVLRRLHDGQHYRVYAHRLSYDERVSHWGSEGEGEDELPDETGP